MDVLYHGSSLALEELRPYPSNALDGEAAVFATDDFDHSVLFGAKWTDFHFMFGQWDDDPSKWKLIEQYPGAFNKLKGVKVYVHILDASLFHCLRRKQSIKNRLPPNEFISYEPVIPIRRKIIRDAYAHLARSDIQLIPYNYDGRFSEEYVPANGASNTSIIIGTPNPWIPEIDELVEYLESLSKKVVRGVNLTPDDLDVDVAIGNYDRKMKLDYVLAYSISNKDKDYANYVASFQRRYADAPTISVEELKNIIE